MRVRIFCLVCIFCLVSTLTPYATQIGNLDGGNNSTDFDTANDTSYDVNNNSSNIDAESGNSNYNDESETTDSSEEVGGEVEEGGEESGVNQLPEFTEGESIYFRKGILNESDKDGYLYTRVYVLCKDENIFNENTMLNIDYNGITEEISFTREPGSTSTYYADLSIYQISPGDVIGISLVYNVAYADITSSLDFKIRIKSVLYETGNISSDNAFSDNTLAHSNILDTDTDGYTNDLSFTTVDKVRIIVNNLYGSKSIAYIPYGDFNKILLAGEYEVDGEICNVQWVDENGIVLDETYRFTKDIEVFVQIVDGAVLSGREFNAKLSSLCSDDVLYFMQSPLSYNNVLKKEVIDVSEYQDKGALLYKSGNTVYWQSLSGQLKFNVDASNMFYNLQHLSSIDCSNFSTNECTTFSNLFSRCFNIVHLDISQLDTSNVDSFSGMFMNCSSLEIIVYSNTFVTRRATNLSNIFCGCFKLNNLDVSNWNTERVTNMEGVFNFCSNMTTIDCSNWDTSRVVSFRNMFNETNNCHTINVNSWNTSNAEDMYRMFCNIATIELDIGTFDTSKVRNFELMFATYDGRGDQFSNIRYGSMFVPISGSNFNKMYYSNLKVKPSVDLWSGSWNEEGTYVK